MLMFCSHTGANQYSQGAAGKLGGNKCRRRFDYLPGLRGEAFTSSISADLDRQILLVDMLTPMQAGQAAPA